MSTRSNPGTDNLENLPSIEYDGLDGRMRPPRDIFVEQNRDEEMDQGLLDDHEFALVSALCEVRVVKVGK